MTQVWGIDAAVLFHPGSGQAWLAFVLERKRAVGVLTKSKRNGYVKKWAQAAKTLGLARDSRPAKP